MSDLDLSELRPAARRLYLAWVAGEDVRSVASRATVFRHRSAIMGAGGPDVMLPRPSGDVVEFRRILRPVAASVPAELRPFLFDPLAA